MLYTGLDRVDINGDVIIAHLQITGTSFNFDEFCLKFEESFFKTYFVNYEEKIIHHWSNYYFFPFYILLASIGCLGEA